MVGNSSDNPRYPVRFVAPRLLALKDKCRALITGSLWIRFWPLVTVVAQDCPPEWGAALLQRCGPECKGSVDCGGKHEPVFTVSGRTSATCYRKFRAAVRKEFRIAEKAPPRPKFVRGPEDRA